MIAVEFVGHARRGRLPAKYHPHLPRELFDGLARRLPAVGVGPVSGCRERPLDVVFHCRKLRQQSRPFVGVQRSLQGIEQRRQPRFFPLNLACQLIGDLLFLGEGQHARLPRLNRLDGGIGGPQ